MSFNSASQVDGAPPDCSAACWQLLKSAAEACRSEQPILARQYYLRALRQDRSGRARQAYARFLTQQQEYASAVAEFSRVLGSLEERPASLEFQREVVWDLIQTYELWGHRDQSRYFLEHAIRLEACIGSGVNTSVANSSGVPLSKPHLRKTSEELGLNLLLSLARGQQEDEAERWLQLGMLSYLQDKWQEALGEFSEALKLARGGRDDNATSHCFLWLGRVFSRMQRQNLATLSFRRAAAWGNGPSLSERGCEYRLRSEVGTPAA
ncbi:MAG: hypothetical protein U0903_09780 [Planctomycetales bacterium]